MGFLALTGEVYASLGATLALSASVAILIKGPKTIRRHRPEPAESVAGLQEELEALKEENARLRSEQQQALHIGKAAAVIREQIASLATSASDTGDDAWGALAEITVLRATLVAACEDLQTAIHHVHAQLTSGIPGPELDRRRTDRQPAGPEARREGGGPQGRDATEQGAHEQPAVAPAEVVRPAEPPGGPQAAGPHQARPPIEIEVLEVSFAEPGTPQSEIDALEASFGEPAAVSLQNQHHHGNGHNGHQDHGNGHQNHNGHESEVGLFEDPFDEPEELSIDRVAMLHVPEAAMEGPAKGSRKRPDSGL